MSCRAPPAPTIRACIFPAAISCRAPAEPLSSAEPLPPFRGETSVCLLVTVRSSHSEAVNHSDDCPFISLRPRGGTEETRGKIISLQPDGPVIADGVIHSHPCHPGKCTVRKRLLRKRRNCGNACAQITAAKHGPAKERQFVVAKRIETGAYEVGEHRRRSSIEGGIRRRLLVVSPVCISAEAQPAIIIVGDRSGGTIHVGSRRSRRTVIRHILIAAASLVFRRDLCPRR